MLPRLVHLPLLVFTAVLQLLRIAHDHLSSVPAVYLSVSCDRFPLVFSANVLVTVPIHFFARPRQWRQEGQEED